MKLIRDNWQILVALVTITFGYANFTSKVEAHDIKLKSIESMQIDIQEIKIMVNRIDERTSRRK